MGDGKGMKPHLDSYGRVCVARVLPRSLGLRRLGGARSCRSGRPSVTHSSSSGVGVVDGIGGLGRCIGGASHRASRHSDLDYVLPCLAAHPSVR